MNVPDSACNPRRILEPFRFSFDIFSETIQLKDGKKQADLKTLKLATLRCLE